MVKNVGNKIYQLVINTISPPRDPKESFAGKTILMPGTSDIGIEAAIKFARLGAAKIIIGDPKLSMANSVKTVIERESGCKTGIVKVLPLEIGSFPSIEAFVNNIQKLTCKVHAVILDNNFNYNSSDSGVKEGLHGADLCLQVNLISKAYLAILLLGLLLQTSLDEESPTHLEFVGAYADYDLETFKRIEPFTNMNYSIIKHLKNSPGLSYQFTASKITEMAIVQELAKRDHPSKVVATVACPGFCEDPEWNNCNSTFSRPKKLWKRLFARTCEQGSRTLVSGVLQGRKAHGKLWENDCCQIPKGWSRDKITTRQLSGGVWADLIKGFGHMRNRDTIKAIMPNGHLAKDMSALRRLHPLEYNLPLTGDNDLSFWSADEDTVDREEEPAAEETGAEESATQSRLQSRQQRNIWMVQTVTGYFCPWIPREFNQQH